MTVETLLARLDSVKETGKGRWIARCSSHSDQRPSLAIRELDDGRVLLKCFAECETRDVLNAVGMSYTDLFPKAADFHKPAERRPFNAIDILRCIAFESLIVSVSASRLAKPNETLNEQDRERLFVAAARLQNAAEVANHGL